MALRFMDGCDWAGSRSDIGMKWDAIVYPNVLNGGRTNPSGKSYQTDGWPAVKKILDAQATWIAGRGFYANTTGTPTSGGRMIIEFLDSGTRQLGLEVSNGALRVLRGSTVLATSSYTLQGQQWYYIELKATIHGSAGSYEVRVNRQTVLSATGVNTQNTANASANEVGFGGDGTSWGDDFYICDATGTRNNDFLGDVEVVTLMPAGAGNYAQWTPLSGANWENVDEIPQDGDTSYNYSATAGQKDTFGAQTYSATGTPLGLQVNLIHRKDDAGSRTIRTLLRSGGADYSGTSESVLDSYSHAFDVWETDPADSADWTDTKINAAEYGYEMVS